MRVRGGTDFVRLLGGLVAVVLLSLAEAAAPAADLVGHWRLLGDCKDSSGNGNHGVNHGVDLSGSDGAAFNGIDSYIEVPSSPSLDLGTAPFAVAVRIHTEARLTDVIGDVLAKFDPATRTGATLSIMNYAGVTNAQSNYRNLAFGIDAGRVDSRWADCGRPGNNHFVRALVVYDGDLYAATWEPGEDEAGHVYRYAGGKEWIDCGSPDKANAVAALAVYDGKLYAGSELYTGGGSALPLSPNKTPGGSVFRYQGGRQWANCGKLDKDLVSVSSLAVFDGKLYAGTGTSGSFRKWPRTKGMYRYDGGTKWIACGCPQRRVVHLGVYNGHIFALSYDGGYVFRYEGGTRWTELSQVPQTTQVYSLMVYQGKLHVCTWPKAMVFRYDGPQTWTSIGRLGEEEEAMGVSVYNGKLYVGTLPLAQVYRHDGGTDWTPTGRLDTTPDVRYRRAWSMAVYAGKLYCGVLPSGHVHCLEAGKCVTHDRALPPGWRHIAAVKDDDRLRLYVDGRPVATSSTFKAADFNLSNTRPLRIGFGQHDYFNGKMCDLRVYHGVLSEEEIRAISQ